MNSGLCLILWIYFDSFCSGQAKSRCGGVLAVDFRWFLPPTFLQNSWLEGQHKLNLTYINEFHKFCWIFECRNSVCKNWLKWEKSQAGRPIPREFHVHLWSECSRVQMQANPMWFHTKYTNQDRKAWAIIRWVHMQYSNSTPSPKPSMRRICNHWSTRRWIGGLRRDKPRPGGLGQAAQHPTASLRTNATETDFIRQLGAYSKKVANNGRHPQAGRPHFFAPHVQPSRGRYTTAMHELTAWLSS